MRRKSLGFIALVGGIGLAQAGGLPECQLSSLEGGGHRLHQIQGGKVLYLDFWASWCSTCARSFRFLNSLTEELSDQGLKVVAVNLDEDPREAQAFLARYPAHFSVFWDPHGDCARAFEVGGMPAAYLIDRQGEVRYRYLGFHSGEAEELRRKVQALLAESLD